MFGVVRFIFRSFGFVLLAIAVIYGISDGSKSIAQSDLVYVPLGQVWYQISPETLNTAQAVVQRYVHPTVWDPFLQTILTWPVWAVLAPLGIAIILSATRRRLERPQFA